METKKTYRDAWNTGWVSGLVALSIAALGLVELFETRNIVAGVLAMGQLLVFITPVIMSYNFTKNLETQKNQSPAFAAIIGSVSSLPLIVLVLLSSLFDIRDIFVNVSPTLINILSFGMPNPYLGSLVLLLAITAVSVLGVLTQRLPDRWRNSLFTGLATLIVVGMFSEILTERIRFFFSSIFGTSVGSAIVRFLFVSKAIQIIPAIVIFLVACYFGYKKDPHAKKEKSKRSFIVDGKIQWKSILPVAALLLVLPLILGTYLSEVTNNVGIYILMGLGLNIVVGFAGLLDLGYVAFFAIGAYTMAVLTSTGPLGLDLPVMNFWLALPICVLVAALAGITLGIPVLRMRGDYLAIVTLGFGEIISRLAISDMLKPFIGGAQGVLQIPKPSIGSITFTRPELMYYVVLAGVGLALFVSWRLRDSRLGRQWMAMREDEDVAEAMGINLMKTKILAFAVGAAFSGLSGAIFASKLTSIFPHSFSVLISINVLSLIIVGGIGSLPGVAVGALVLVGLPELLREFAEYRLLMYGVLLIVMMLAKPEGFVPSEIHKRELHVDEATASEATE